MTNLEQFQEVYRVCLEMCVTKEEKEFLALVVGRTLSKNDDDTKRLKKPFEDTHYRTKVLYQKIFLAADRLGRLMDETAELYPEQPYSDFDAKTRAVVATLRKRGKELQKILTFPTSSGRPLQRRRRYYFIGALLPYFKWRYANNRQNPFWTRLCEPLLPWLEAIKVTDSKVHKERYRRSKGLWPDDFNSQWVVVGEPRLNNLCRLWWKKASKNIAYEASTEITEAAELYILFKHSGPLSWELDKNILSNKDERSYWFATYDYLKRLNALEKTGWTFFFTDVTMNMMGVKHKGRK